MKSFYPVMDIYGIYGIFLLHAKLELSVDWIAFLGFAVPPSLKRNQSVALVKIGSTNPVVSSRDPISDLSSCCLTQSSLRGRKARGVRSGSMPVLRNVNSICLRGTGMAHKDWDSIIDIKPHSKLQRDGGIWCNDESVWKYDDYTWAIPTSKL